MQVARLLEEASLEANSWPEGPEGRLRIASRITEYITQLLAQRPRASVTGHRMSSVERCCHAEPRLKGVYCRLLQLARHMRDKLDSAQGSVGLRHVQEERLSAYCMCVDLEGVRPLSFLVFSTVDVC